MMRACVLGAARLSFRHVRAQEQVRSGSISVQIIVKERGKYRVVQTVGTSSDQDQIERQYLQAASTMRRPDPPANRTVRSLPGA